MNTKDAHDIVVLGGARDYHAMDWFHTIKIIASERSIIFLTDLIEGEGFRRIVKDDDKVLELLIIDRYLFNKGSRLADVWRNFFKIVILPVQIVLLRRYYSKHPSSIFHAQPMYYMLLCWAARIPFIGTPQGSEILVRPVRSKVYRWFCKKILASAQFVTVDSESMKSKIFEISGVKALIIQNGIDIDEIDRTLATKSAVSRNKICSIRALTPLYQIDKIVQSESVYFVYPFADELYRASIFASVDQKFDLGRLGRQELYSFLSGCSLVISIPKSDSSPRSVYESIFCGCCVAVTENKWVDALPDCMKKRIIIVDLENEDWLTAAIEHSENVVRTPYTPSEQALNLFDQARTMSDAINVLYG